MLSGFLTVGADVTCADGHWQADGHKVVNGHWRADDHKVGNGHWRADGHKVGNEPLAGW